MSRSKVLARGAVALTLVGGLGCGHADNKVLGPTFTGANLIFKSYVSLGNSITAGFQSGGINDSTQRRSYAVLLAQQFRTRFAYPSLRFPGCPPPFKDVSGAPIAVIPGPNQCALRDPALATDVLNNVAVPGATSFDPAASSTASSNALTTLFLGGKSQVKRALDASPTFATIWIGNNDVLGPALSGVLVPFPGVSPGVTPQATFVTNYSAMISGLTSGAPGIKGVLIAVVQVSAAPELVPGAIIFASAALQGAISFASGKAVTVLPDCQGSSSLVSLLLMIQNIRSGAHPPFIACQKGDFPPSPLVGELFILDAQEQATLGADIAAYNAYIKTTADQIGFAFYDPNISLAALKASGAIPLAPNFLSPTPFGQYFSFDGVHPSSAAHILLANDLIDVINAKYGTQLTKVPTS